MWMPGGRGLGLFHWHVAAILYLVPERCHARIQIGDAHGGRAHIDAAPSLTEIEGRADNLDVRAGH
jgi:hypothetical protein